MQMYVITLLTFQHSLVERTIVWCPEHHNEVRCFWKTCGYCSVVWVRNDDKNNLLDVETTNCKWTICSLNTSTLPRNRWCSWLAERGASKVCTHATNHSCHLQMGETESSIQAKMFCCWNQHFQALSKLNFVRRFRGFAHCKPSQTGPSWARPSECSFTLNAEPSWTNSVSFRENFPHFYENFIQFLQKFHNFQENFTYFKKNSDNF